MSSRLLTLVLATLALLIVQNTSATDPRPTELRGVWLTNVDSDVLGSRAKIAEAMRFLAAHHFNAVYPVVWNDARTLYRSAQMDSLFGMPIDPAYGGRDPLAEVVAEGHKNGLKVIAWFEYGFATSYQKDGGLILEKFPHWAARDREGRLLEKNGFEWMNAYHPEVREFILGLVEEVVRDYDVDGVQGDDRLPAQPAHGGYSDYTRRLYAAEHDGCQPPDDPREPSWLRWRADRLNAFARELYQRVKAVRPRAIVSWSPSPYPWSYEEYLQDWPAWLRGGYADQVLPQHYRYDIEAYDKSIADLQQLWRGQAHLRQRVFPGVLMNVRDYVIAAEFLAQSIGRNRERGFAGESYFFYEGLRKNDGALAQWLREGPYRYPADFPIGNR